MVITKELFEITEEDYIEEKNNVCKWIAVQVNNNKLDFLTESRIISSLNREKMKENILMKRIVEKIEICLSNNLSQEWRSVISEILFEGNIFNNFTYEKYGLNYLEINDDILNHINDSISSFINCYINKIGE